MTLSIQITKFKFHQCQMRGNSPKLPAIRYDLFPPQTLELVKAAQLSKLQSSGDTEVVTDPLQVFHEAIENSKPIMGTMSVKKAGKLYHVSSYITNTSMTYRRMGFNCEYLLIVNCQFLPMFAIYRFINEHILVYYNINISS